jgi:hypothetical protein
MYPRALINRILVVSTPSGISEPHGLKSIDVVHFGRTSTSSGFEDDMRKTCEKKKGLYIRL